jgi:hypothetical protein
MSAPPGMEDPISSIFDLSDHVARMAPTMRRMYRYTATVVVLFLVIMVVLLFVGLADNLAFAVLALVALVFGAIALSLLVETDRFYRSFVERHRSIRLLQDADPAPKVPEGRTPVARLTRYLAQTSPRLGEELHLRPDSLRTQVRLPAEGGADAPFDLVWVAPASAGYRWFGAGDAGFAVLARIGPDAPTLADLERFASEVGAVAARLPAQVRRAILLRAHPVPIPEEVYDRAVGRRIPVRGGSVALEIISENADGTYDLVPHVLGVP